MRQLLTGLILIVIQVLLDIYILKRIAATPKKWAFLQKNWFNKTYRIGSAGLIAMFLSGVYLTFIGVGFRSAFLLLFFLSLICRVSLLVFLIFDDLRITIIRF